MTLYSSKDSDRNLSAPIACDRCGRTISLGGSYHEDAITLGAESIIGAENPSVVEEHFPTRLCTNCHRHLGAFLTPTEATLKAENPYNAPDARPLRRPV